MKTISFRCLPLAAAIGLLAAATACADSTISPTSKYAWGANIGWLNWRDANSATQGASLGEYTCCGWIWSGNVGWISLGGGSPANGVQYLNNSATDYGVNVTDQTNDGGVLVAKLRGFAYGANIGWINFENTGNPRVDLSTGKLLGYAWGANIGWINLGASGSALVVTTSLAAAPDTDHDGIADAYEYAHAGNLSVLTATGDADHDGVTDLQEYLADTNPLDPLDSLRITSITRAGLTSYALVWTSRPTRVYTITRSPDLTPASWIDSGLGSVLPDTGATTSRQVAKPATGKGFWRVIAHRPLAAP